jgi:hypothetical protein
MVQVVVAWQGVGMAQGCYWQNLAQVVVMFADVDIPLSMG